MKKSEKEITLDSWGEKYILSKESYPKLKSTLECISNEENYVIIFEKEIPSISGPPGMKKELLGFGKYADKKDLESKFYKATVNFAEDYAKNHGLKFNNLLDKTIQNID